MASVALSKTFGPFAGNAANIVGAIAILEGLTPTQAAAASANILNGYITNILSIDAENQKNNVPDPDYLSGVAGFAAGLDPAFPFNADNYNSISQLETVYAWWDELENNNLSGYLGALNTTNTALDGAQFSIGEALQIAGYTPAQIQAGSVSTASISKMLDAAILASRSNSQEQQNAAAVQTVIDNATAAVSVPLDSSGQAYAAGGPAPTDVGVSQIALSVADSVSSGALPPTVEAITAEVSKQAAALNKSISDAEMLEVTDNLNLWAQSGPGNYYNWEQALEALYGNPPYNGPDEDALPTIANYLNAGGGISAGDAALLMAWNFSNGNPLNLPPSDIPSPDEVPPLPTSTGEQTAVVVVPDNSAPRGNPPVKAAGFFSSLSTFEKVSLGVSLVGILLLMAKRKRVKA